MKNQGEPIFERPHPKTEAFDAHGRDHPGLGTLRNIFFFLGGGGGGGGS